MSPASQELPVFIASAFDDEKQMYKLFLEKKNKNTDNTTLDICAYAEVIILR